MGNMKEMGVIMVVNVMVVIVCMLVIIGMVVIVPPLWPDVVVRYVVAKWKGSGGVL